MNATNASWPEVRIGQILSYTEELIKLDDLQEYITITVKRRHGGLEPREKLFGHQIKTKKQYRLIPGAFLISRIQCWHQAYAIVPEDIPANMIASTNYDQFIISPEVDPRYLWWFSHSPLFTETVRSSAFGVVIEKMVFNRDAWLEKTIPLPPLEEQRRIVSRIEELAAKVEKARDLRADSSQKLSMLKNRATESLFESLRCADEPLGSLLREDSLNGISTRPEDDKLGIEILRISAGTSRGDGVVDENDVKYLPFDRAQVEKYQLRPSDLLACRFNGNLSFVGRFSLYSGYRNRFQVYPDKLIRFRVDESRVFPGFVRYAMNSPEGRSKIEAMCATTAGNLGISATQLKTVTVPVPSPIEQRRIVAYLDDLHAKVDSLKKLQSETAAELDALMPSMISRAFRGEL